MRITINYRPERRIALILLACALSASSVLAQDGLEPADAAGEVGAILDIAVGEYSSAVDETGVIDSLEYEETRLLLAQARGVAEATLAGDGDASLRVLAALDSAEARMERVAAPAELIRALDEARSALFDGWGTLALAVPNRPLSLEHGKALYEQHCAACHGASGRGDGPAAPADPPPADFTDPAVVLETSPARFFQVTSYGIPGTAMPGWRDRLDAQERWEVVAYLNRLGVSDAAMESGGELIEGQGGPSKLPAEFRSLAGLTGLEVLEALGVDAGVADAETDPTLRAAVAYARTRLEAGAQDGADPALVASEVRAELARALDLHGQGDYEAAQRAAFQAYMSFEPMERELAPRAPGLNRSLEGRFFRIREMLGEAEAGAESLEETYAGIDAGLADAVAELSGQPSIWSDFFGSLLIIVREGVEAILIIGALLAFLVRSGHADQRSAIYAGVGLALALSLVTAAVVELVFHLAPAQQELLEGLTMLIAVGVLFSVSYWLVSKIEVQHWQAYIRQKMSEALSTRSQFALGSVAFFAVYREGVETVLFYAALTQAAGSPAMVGVGFLVGLLALAAIYLGVYKFGMRIPLRPFFGATSGLLYLMAFVFAGKGIRELQEAGVIGITSLTGVPSLEILGVYPTVETLLVQGLLLAAFVAALVWTFILAPVRRRSLALDTSSQ